MPDAAPARTPACAVRRSLRRGSREAGGDGRARSAAVAPQPYRVDGVGEEDQMDTGRRVDDQARPGETGARAAASGAS
jgi:hypothetical protein